jgi:hypothetical protein
VNILRKILLLGALLPLSSLLYAQDKDSIITLHGSLYDSKDLSPVEFAHIINLNNPYATISDSSGYFDIKMYQGDTLHITCIGYEDRHISYNQAGPAIFKSIPLNQKSYNIESVKITPWKTYQDFKNKFISLDLDDPREKVHPLIWEGLPSTPLNMEPEEPNIGNPVSFLYDIFSGNREERIKYKEILSRETKKRKIRSKYNKEIVSNLTGLKGEKLKEFMDFCNFTDQELLNRKAYDILMEVKLKYKVFKKREDTVTKKKQNNE